MLNEVPYNNDVMHVAHIMLIEMPNSNDVIRIGNNVYLIAMDAQQFSMATI